MVAAMEEITSCNKIILEEEDEAGLIIEQEDNAPIKWCLVCRFLTDRAINSQAMKNTLAAL